MAVDASDNEGFLAGGGELGERMRSHDWAATPLGPPSQWPRSLKTVVRIMLTSRQPIWIGWGPELIYLYNDPYKAIIGGKHPWALGRPTEVVWKEIWKDIAPLLSSAMSGDGTFVESQLLIMERNGYPEETYYTFSYSPIPGDDGAPAGIICANADETQRVISERQLALLREVAARAGDARTVADACRQCLQALQSDPRDLPFGLVFLRPVGGARLTLAGGTLGVASLGRLGAWLDPAAAPWEADAVIAHHAPRLVEALPGGDWPRGGWDRPPTAAMVLPLPASGDDGVEGVLVVGLNPYRLPDARYRDFLSLVAQQVASAVGNARAYERQHERAEELARLDRAKTQFFSNVSHEFRTPLTLMLGPLSDLLDRTDELPPALLEPLRLAHRNAARLSRLVNSLLDFSRLEAGRLQARFRPTDLTERTRELAGLFRSAVERAGLRFEVDCAPLSQPAWVDLDLWEKVVLNLLSNALKFTLQGRIALSLQEVEGQAVLAVADTGVGVPADELPRLFERFHRVEGSRGRTHEGSGIGLALVQELVRLHGGEVTAQSRLDEGTTFTVRLPLGHRHLPREQVEAQPSASGPVQASAFVQEALRWLPGTPGSADAATPATPTPDARAVGRRYHAALGARIVLADDNADMRDYVSQLLSPLFRIEAVGDGEAALAAVRRERPALLLSDVMMPRLDGFGLLAAVRSDDALRTLPVILLSARAGEESRVEGLDAGADDYLVKPFTARELLARVTAIIELDRLRRSAEEQMRLGLASARMIVWEIDLDTSRVSASANASEILGRGLTSLDEGYASVHPDDLPRHRERLEAAVAARGELSDEIRIRRPDTGEERWMQVRARVLCDEQDRPRQLTGVSFDITDRKRVEAERQVLLDDLREQDRRKDEFLAMLAHELRNPLAPIRNGVELVQRLAPPDPRLQSAGQIIRRQVEQLGRLVDDLLDVSRITRGRIELQHRPVDLDTVARRALETVEPLVRERRHRVAMVSRREPLTVMGDELRLQQCAVNLLTNAAKYTDPGGDIRVELAREDGEAVLRVQDNGVGLSAELLPRVFELFVQSDRTLDRSQGGLGIGLSVVKRLMEMQGGRVCADSAGPGRGALFELRLPVTPLQPTVTAAQPFPAAGAMKVLVVDDNRDAADSLATMLALEGHEVTVAYGPHEALQAAQADAPQAVMLDIGLPGMDGYEVARRLRALRGRAPLRLVALSGYGQPADRERSKAAGFDLHLVKPASLAAVLAAVAGGEG
ncbi:ATP-binding protein [Aquabacterium sp. J223]|uniref:ATP-binding protein n=1 Tax=Aquabacterium sp. J223 TaxID=2898431 RepID=UPI0021ADDF5D|nr:ATP-binding protein [Aquabacterium sp. J223]UUX95405.1 ATP-binding protein [Aquabacterium sp. J223]